MKATIEFNLPEDREEYENCYKGSNYISALREIVEFLRNKIKYEDDEDERNCSVLEAHEKVYERIFWICKQYGFSPWED